MYLIKLILKLRVHLKGVCDDNTHVRSWSTPKVFRPKEILAIIVQSTQYTRNKLQKSERCILDSKFNEECDSKSHLKSKHWKPAFFYDFSTTDEIPKIPGMQRGDNKSNKVLGSVIPQVLNPTKPN